MSAMSGRSALRLAYSSRFAARGVGRVIARFPCDARAVTTRAASCLLVRLCHRSRGLTIGRRFMLLRLPNQLVKLANDLGLSGDRVLVGLLTRDPIFDVAHLAA